MPGIPAHQRQRQSRRYHPRYQLRSRYCRHAPLKGGRTAASIQYSHIQSSTPVTAALSSIQTLLDMMTIRQRKGHLDHLISASAAI